MSEPALYRKYRPKNWDEVIGQEAVVEALTGALKAGRVVHAYIFSGSRGTGKTSVARIFARSLGTAERDIYEIDAASNTSVDDIRALNESIHALPFSSRYKVYIIDEAHMLSKSAFNALLKTLEEPPTHVIFILATTEPHKVPETVVSRCQVFDFRKPTLPTLAKLIAEVAKKEGYTLDKPSAELIGLLAEGSFRDAFGILQKIITVSTNKQISAEEVEKITGAPRAALVIKFVEGIHQRNTDLSLSALTEAADGGINMKVFLTLILRQIRFVLLLRYGGDAFKTRIASETPPKIFESLTAMAIQKNSGISSKAVLELLNAYDLLGFAALPTLPIELAVIKIISNDQSPVADNH
jgi:DNA polymerase-3 subunit gamma/tau